MEEPKQTQTVSVLLPTYNRPKLIHESLDSLLSQSRPVDELMVVLDGPCNDTLSVLKTYGDQIRYVEKPNGGKSSALNLGMTLVCGDLIWIFDDDDIALPDALEKLEGLLIASPDVDFAYGRHDRFFVGSDGKVEFAGTGYWKDCPPDEFLWQTLLDLFVHQGGMLVRRSLYDAVGPFDETLPRSQDYEMLLRLAFASKGASTQDVLFHQRQHNGARGPQNQSFVSNRSEQMWCKYDGEIFQRLYRRIGLSEFSRQLKSDDGPLGIRRAFIRRGVVMARKKLWNLAYNDFYAAALVSELPLTDEEVTDLRESFGSKFQTNSILKDSEARRKLLSLSKLSRTGASICGALGRGLYWRIRDRFEQGNFADGLGYLKLVSEFVLYSKLPSVQVDEPWQETPGQFKDI